MFRSVEREYRTFHSVVFDDLLHEIEVAKSLGKPKDEVYSWGADEWIIPNYINKELAIKIRLRVNNLIEKKYKWREIGPEVYQFKDFMVSALSEAASEWGRAYLLYDSKVESAGTSNSRSRDIQSSYPQAQLRGTNDYASNANDSASELENKLSDSEVVRIHKELFDEYHDIDMKLVNSVEPCFRTFY